MPHLFAPRRAPWPKQLLIIGTVLSWVGVAAVAQGGPYANAQDRPQGDPPVANATAVGPGDAIRNQVVSKLRAAMSGVGIDDPDVQNSLLEFFKQDEIGKRKLRQSANRLAYALRNNANADLINQVMKEYKDCLDSDKTRREQAQKSLDAQIGYSDKPRLEAILLLMGVLGDGSSFVSASLLSPRPNSANTAANTAGPGDGGGNPGRMPPAGLLPSANSSAVLGGTRLPFAPPGGGPRGGSVGGPTALPDGNPFGVARSGTGAARNGHEPGNGTNVPETSLTTAPAGANTGGGNSTSTTTLPPPRPLPPSPKGTTIGTVDKKGVDWIDIRAEDGTVERYIPAWRGGAQGGFDPKIVQLIQDVGIGDKVQADWEYFERKRILKLVALTGDHKDDKN